MQLFVDDFLYRHHRYTRQDAEDLAQDVHIECWKGKAHFRGEARFKTWLDMVALNACVRFLRQARKDCLVCENEMGEVPLACLIDKERQEREKALRQRQERCDDLSRLFS
ncbi:MAG: hypothetical protein IT210_13645, partial [Armatimonadetes bacterium]|nr:hypothetical protein [Armatimonadota bacterium]